MKMIRPIIFVFFVFTALLFSGCSAVIFRDDAELYNILGDIYAEQTHYLDAEKNYSMALKKEPEYQLAQSNLIWAMFQAREYQKCIDFCLALESSGEESFESCWYLAVSYESLLEEDKAIASYQKALAFDEGDDSDTCHHMAILYKNKRNFEKAEEYNKLSLSYNPNNPDAIWLSKEIALIKMPLSNQLDDFITTYYLYQDTIPDFNAKLANLKEIDENGSGDIESVLSQIIPENDYFSYLLTGSYYQEYRAIQEENSVFYLLQSENEMNFHHFKIKFFSPKTGFEFISLAEQIQDKQDSVLVLDLRNNSGGDMKSANDILDFLLGQCSTCSFIDKDGYSSSYYSDGDKVAFDQIFVLTDRNTASAAEFLALGLKTFNSNTTIIGETTFGKGVCQYVFDSPENGFALFLVNSYWNVRENNIGFYGITPDVEVKSQDDYEQAILESIQN